MAEYVHCGFVRSYVLLASLQKHSSQVYDWLIKNLTKDLSIELPDEKKKVKLKFKHYVNHNKRIPTNKRKELIDAFSLEKWATLTKEEQLRHSFKNCQVGRLSLFYLQS